MEYAVLIIYLAIASFFVAKVWIRNNRVFKLRNFVNDKCYEYSIRTYEDGYKKFHSKLPSYDEMFFSRKPLKLETYFTEEEIKELLDL
jgi:hypothetical protein